MEIGILASMKGFVKGKFHLGVHFLGGISGYRCSSGLLARLQPLEATITMAFLEI